MTDEGSHKTKGLLCGVCSGGDGLEGMDAEALEESEEVDDILEEGEIRAKAEEPLRARAAEDGRKVKVLGDPRQPTEAEVEEHERCNHCPYRNW